MGLQWANVSRAEAVMPLERSQNKTRVMFDWYNIVTGFEQCTYAKRLFFGV